MTELYIFHQVQIIFYSFETAECGVTASDREIMLIGDYVKSLSF